MPERKLKDRVRLFDMAINRGETISLAEPESGIAEVKVKALDRSMNVDERLRGVWL